jgi:tetratricopeptide (TPR) repeat protein
VKFISQIRSSPFFAVWLLVFVTRLVLLGRFVESPDFLPNGDDMKFYHDWGRRILAGQWTDGQAFYGLPGYAYALAIIYKIGGVNPYSIGLLQCALDACTALFILRIGDRVFRREVGLLAAFGWLAFTPAQAFTIILMPTSLVIAAFWGLVWWLVKTESAPPWHVWLRMGLLAGFVAMFVATILMLLPLVLVAILMRVRRPLPVLAAVAALFGGVYLGCAPVWMHNYFVAREPVLLSAHSGLNYYIGNNAAATGYPKIPDGLRSSQEGLLRDSLTVAESEAGRKLTRAEVSAFWSAKAKKWIAENRAAWWALLGRKLGNFWNTYQYDDLSIISLLRSQGILPPGLRFGVVAALGLPGLLVGIALVPRSRWVAAGILCHLAALLPVFVNERYRLCSVPGLMLFASYGLWQLKHWLENRRWPAVAGYGAATAVAVWFVTLPRGDIGLWSLDPFNTGIRALKTNNLPVAQRELELAYGYVQTHPEINFALGNLWLAKGDRIKAKSFYAKALQLDPKNVGVWNNIGVIALGEGVWPTAIQSFQTALRLEPNDAKTYYLLALAQRGAGHHDAAKAAIDEAVRLKPEQKEFLELQAQITAPPPAPEAPR